MIKKYFFTFIFFILLSVAVLFADIPAFKEYDIASSKKIMQAEEVLNKTIELVNGFFESDHASRQEILSKIQVLNEKMSLLNAGVENLTVDGSLEDIHNVDVNVLANYLHAVFLAGETVKDYNSEYVEDYIKALEKLKEISRIIYHTKIARIKKQSEYIEKTKFEGEALKFYAYYGQVLDILKSSVKTSLDVDLYSFQYLGGEIEKYELKILIQDNLEQAKKDLKKCREIKPPENFKKIHDILSEAYYKNYIMLKMFSDYLSDAKNINMRDVNELSSQVKELFAEYQFQRFRYMENI
ncbi:MAG: hypothetical protein ABIH00_05740 [Armatimonadota bacterium]